MMPTPSPGLAVLLTYLAGGVVTNIWFAYDFWRYEPKDYGRDWSDWLIVGNPATFMLWFFVLPELVGDARNRRREQAQADD